MNRTHLSRDYNYCIPVSGAIPTGPHKAWDPSQKHPSPSYGELSIPASTWHMSIFLEQPYVDDTHRIHSEHPPPLS
ncbi:hypothetical protein DACRYDRAFT_22660, partial [Dacryopinax primogenitus]